MSITPPTCAYDFVSNDSWASGCLAAFPCLCSDQNFLAMAESSIQQYCDASDQQKWAQYFAQNCPGENTFSTLITTSDSQATATAGVTSPSVAQSTSSSISSSNSTPSNPTTPTPSSPNRTFSTSTTSEISSTTSSSLVVPSGSTGLSVSDKAGIASAVLAGVGIQVAVLLVIYRRKLEACRRRRRS